MESDPRITSKQHPPIWRRSELNSAPPRKKARRHPRNRQFGSNQLFEYCLATNFVMLTGKVTREPREMADGIFVWFRMVVPNQDNERQRLFITVRTRKDVAIHVWENVAVGDEVAVVGQLWTAKRQRVQFVFVDAERVSCSYPVQLDLDARFVRVRADLWNRMAAMVEDAPAAKVPERKKRKLLADIARLTGMDVTIEEAGDHDDLDSSPASTKDTP